MEQSRKTRSSEVEIVEGARIRKGEWKGQDRNYSPTWTPIIVPTNTKREPSAIKTPRTTAFHLQEKQRRKTNQYQKSNLSCNQILFVAGTESNLLFHFMGRPLQVERLDGWSSSLFILVLFGQAIDIIGQIWPSQNSSYCHWSYLTKPFTYDQAISTHVGHLTSPSQIQFSHLGSCHAFCCY